MWALKIWILDILPLRNGRKRRDVKSLNDLVGEDYACKLTDFDVPSASLNRMLQEIQSVLEDLCGWHQR